MSFHVLTGVFVHESSTFKKGETTLQDFHDDVLDIGQAAIDRFCAANPVPPDVVDVLRDTPFPFYAACALTVLFLDAYNTGDGYGVFSGPERYGRLNDRMAHAAQRAFGLFRYWDLLCDSLQVPVFAGRENERLMGFLALPRGLQEQMLRAIHQDHRAIGAVARQWHTLLKCRDPKYAAEHGSPVTGEPAVPTYAADEIAPGSPERAGGSRGTRWPSTGAARARPS